MLNKSFFLLICALVLNGTNLSALTIAEKKAGLSSSGSDLSSNNEQLLAQVNQQTQTFQASLKNLYDQVGELYKKNANECSYKDLLTQINVQKQELKTLQVNWQQSVVQGDSEDEPYALWHQPDTSLEQLVIDYGSLDFVYLIPPEVSEIRLSVASNLPVPRSSWSEMLEIILNQNGVGIKTLNPYLRQLYLVRENRSGLKLITSNREELEVLPHDSRICFVLTPEAADGRRIFNFLERFINLQSTILQLLGRDILIIAEVGDILDLLKLYDFAENNRTNKEYRMISLTRLTAVEMARILEAMFDRIPEQIVESEAGEGRGGRAGGMGSSGDINGLRVMPLENMGEALFIVGTRDEVNKAAEIINSVECQIGEAREKVVYWYTAKHSVAEELAGVLERVYNLMIQTGTGFQKRGDGPNGPGFPPMPPGPPPPPEFRFPEELYKEDFYQSGGFIVNPAPVEPGIPTPIRVNDDRTNFIVDLKTGSIVMVVEADILPRIKELIKKLDVPKKMVQLEVLLFEKKAAHRNDFGLNLLRIGSDASDTERGSILFNDSSKKHPDKMGVFQYLLSTKATNFIPAFDLSYKFLLSQDDIQINACPSVLAVNQTPALISIVEEISLSTGIFDVETAKGTTLKDAFTRAQYGITINITPTIHTDENDDSVDEEVAYVSMDTDITFDTIQSRSDRPDVTRRHINNQARIPDGQSVIIGGLRRKISNDRKESIPFLGELPGIGKLFSISRMEDTTTEMFILITPKIVYEPVEDLCRLRAEAVCRRPGDTPEYLLCVDEARRLENCRLFEQTFTSIFGRRHNRYYPTNDCSCEDDSLEGEFEGK